MAGAIDNRKMGTRILLGAVVLLLGGSMLLYLVPQTPGTGEISTDTVAKIGDQSVSLQEVRDKVNQFEQQRQIPKFFESRLALEILQDLVFQKEIEYEAKRLGITVSDQERADRIRLIVPTAFNGGTFVGMDRYAAEVQLRYQKPVAEFEELIRQGLLEEKFRGSGNKRQRRRPRLARSRTNGTGVRKSRVQSAKGSDFRFGQDAVWLSHHQGDGKRNGSYQGIRRGEGIIASKAHARSSGQTSK